MFIYKQYGPKNGSLAEIRTNKEDNNSIKIFMDGDEFENHFYVGLLLTITGTLFWAFAT